MKILILVIAAFLSGHAIAQDHKFESICKKEIMSLCGLALKETKEILSCLSKNEKELSAECKQEIQRGAKVVQQTTPPGGGPLGMLGGMSSLGPLVPMLLYEGRFVPSNDEGKNTPNLAENIFRLSIPLYKSAEHTVSTSLSNSIISLNEKTTLSSGLSLPKDFYRTEIGLQYSRRLEGHKAYGFQGNFGYTGDEFNSETKTYTLSANYSFPASNGGHWVLMLNLSNNTPFGNGIPIPGFFYVHRTPTFTGVFGLPVMSMQWTPIERWAFSLSALGPIIRTEASYGTIEETQYFLGASWTQQRYILTERQQEDDRLTFEEKRVGVGIRRPIGKKIYAEIRTGYEFDRYIYVGEKLFDKAGGQEKLENSYFVGWSLRLFF